MRRWERTKHPGVSSLQRACWGPESTMVPALPEAWPLTGPQGQPGTHSDTQTPGTVIPICSLRAVFLSQGQFCSQESPGSLGWYN